MKIKMHMSLPMLNLPETERFYTVLFGEKPVKKKPDYLKFDAAGFNLNISFHLSDILDENPRERHLGFELERSEDLDRLYEKFREENMISEERAVGVCCYARQDKFWLQDPSGFRWEFYTREKDTHQRNDADYACCPEYRRPEPVEQTCC